MPETVFDPQCLRMITYLRQGRDAEARNLAANAAGRRGAEWTYLNVLIPSVYALGEQFVAGVINGKTCDRCVESVFSIMDDVKGALKRRGTLGRRIFASFLPGHGHSVGFIAICHWLERDGWEVVMPGEKAKEEEIVEGIVREKPDVVALTCSVPKNVVHARRVIRAVRGRGVNASVWVGGLPINAVPGLFEKTGADKTAKDIVAFTRMLATEWGYETMTPGELTGGE